MAEVLYLFPDTQLFFQCRPLEQLDWAQWESFEEVHLIVSRPVQVEVDEHKNKGSGRRSDHARKATRLFRSIITSADKFKMIRAKDPVVKLFVQLQIEPSVELSQLNYTRPDHQLIGIAHAFAKQHAGADVRVLTDDGGVVGSADMLAFPFVEIPEEWLLPPETSDDNKRITALQKEVERLRSIEPKPLIECLDPDRRSVSELKIERQVYPPLSADEVEKLMRRLQEGCPVAKDFGSKDPPERSPKDLMRTMGVIAPWTHEYIPASEKSITDYRENKYPAWVAGCQKMLEGLHEALNAEIKTLTVWVSLKNEGTRPGKDVLVTVSATGNFLIMPTRHVDPDDEAEPSPPISLPLPPEPPQGKWEMKKPYGGILDHAGLLRTFGSQMGEGPPMADLLRGLTPPRYEPPDPSFFYLTDRRPNEPVASFSRECQQWRHSIPAEEVGVEIYFDAASGGAEGLLECGVHAENLSSPATMRVPVRIVVAQADTFGHASTLVEHATDERYSIVARHLAGRGR